MPDIIDRLRIETNREPHEPIWTDAIAEIHSLRKGINCVSNLIDESYGVAGLHLNGDIATWSELRSGGRFEEWLSEFDLVQPLRRHQNDL